MKIINEGLLAEMGGPGLCGYCGAPGPRDVHHLWGRGFGGGHRLDVRINVLALCRVCHDKFHNSRSISLGEMTAKAATREAATPDDVTEAIWFLQRLEKTLRPAKIEAALAELTLSVAWLARKELIAAGKLEVPF